MDNPYYQGHRPRLSSDNDIRYVRQPSPSESYTNRRHPESMYESHNNIGGSVTRPVVRKNKALALLQEFQEAEEQRLAELHRDYKPSLDTKRLDAYTQNFTTTPSTRTLLLSELPGSESDPTVSNTMMRAELDASLDHLAQWNAQRLSQSKTLPGKGRGNVYRKPLPFDPNDEYGMNGSHLSLPVPLSTSTPKEYHSTENLIELDAVPQEKPMPELMGSEPAGTFYAAGQWRPCLEYGDKRYNTLPGEPFPVPKRRALSDTNIPPSSVVPSAPNVGLGPGVAVRKGDTLQVGNTTTAGVLRPDTDPRSGLPLIYR